MQHASVNSAERQDPCRAALEAALHVIIMRRSLAGSTQKATGVPERVVVPRQRRRWGQALVASDKNSSACS